MSLHPLYYLILNKKYNFLISINKNTKQIRINKGVIYKNEIKNDDCTVII